MKLVYPAIFTPFDDETGYTVEFPDLPGCVTEGDSLSNAIYMATDAASGWVLTELEDGNKAPKESDIESVKAPKGSFVSLVALDMDSYADKFGKKAVKKTLTIPAWMETYVEKHKISCSEVLQNALNKMIAE
ncbi:MAG: type II toxin-antitoxin system HicB family antitoxin [Lachnospiraceae bacterium]|nr:type II toxin-antitoxin system HicB family antitoxin [Lachnospiraceae bacterium]